MDKKLTKTLNISGKKGDNYMVNAWGKGTALPETDNDKKRRFGVEVVFVGTDGTEDVHYTNFSPDILDWAVFKRCVCSKKKIIPALRCLTHTATMPTLRSLMGFPCSGGVWTDVYI